MMHKQVHRHPGVIRLLEVVVSNSVSVDIVLQAGEQDLLQMCEQAPGGRLEAQKVKRLLHPIADALEFMHA